MEKTPQTTASNPEDSGAKVKLVEKKYLLTFILITSLFAMWGFANDVTHPMVAAFQTLMEITVAKASLVQFAFYAGYATMAVPAALFIRKYSYKKGILLGLSLYAIGTFLFIPAAILQSFAFFCGSLYILTFGLAFLETTANPFILKLGDKATATQRLNLAQAFNPIGSLCGMSVASFIVLPQLWSDKRDAAGQIIFHALPETEKMLIRTHDLAIIRNPYVAIGLVVVLLAIVIAFVKTPQTVADGKTAPSRETLRRLWRNTDYRQGVWAQVCYVGAQIMVWTFIIQYADRLGINKATAQQYNIVAMVLFLSSRFITTALMKYIDSRRLLAFFGMGAMLFAAGAIIFTSHLGLYCLVAISFFMSLMFPTIYGIALGDVQEADTTLGAAFLVMAIVGGALLPPFQGMLIDQKVIFGHPATNVSFILPLLCFLAVTLYGLKSKRRAQQ